MANLKSDEYKLDIYELKNVPGNLSNLKSKAEKIDIWKIETTLFALLHLMLLKRLYMINWLKKLIILILLILVI